MLNQTLRFCQLTFVLICSALFISGCINQAEKPVISAKLLPQTENAVVADDGRLYLATTRKVYSLSDVTPDDLEPVFSQADCEQITGLAHANNRLYIGCIRNVNTSWFKHKGDVHILDLADLSQDKIELEQVPMLANGMSVFNHQLYISNSHLPLSNQLDEIIRVSLNTADNGQQDTALAKRSGNIMHPNGLQHDGNYLYYIDGSHFNRLIMDDKGNVRELETLIHFKGIADDFTIKDGIAYIALFTPTQNSIVEFDLATQTELQRHPTYSYIPSSLVWFKNELYATSYFNGGLYRIPVSHSASE